MFRYVKQRVCDKGEGGPGEDNYMWKGNEDQINKSVNNMTDGDKTRTVKGTKKKMYLKTMNMGKKSVLCNCILS